MENCLWTCGDCAVRCSVDTSFVSLRSVLSCHPRCWSIRQSLTELKRACGKKGSCFYRWWSCVTLAHLLRKQLWEEVQSSTHQREGISLCGPSQLDEPAAASCVWSAVSVGESKFLGLSVNSEIIWRWGRRDKPLSLETCLGDEGCGVALGSGSGVWPGSFAWWLEYWAGTNTSVLFTALLCQRVKKSAAFSLVTCPLLCTENKPNTLTSSTERWNLYLKNAISDFFW